MLTRQKDMTLFDVALLLLRATYGSLLMGHGAQKLFGWFGGHGLKGTGQWLESMGFQPGQRWTPAVIWSELGGGALTALGFLNPIGPLSTLGSMGVATFRVHWGKPIWVTAGGAELPVTNAAIATALAIAGPGKFSLDELLGTRLPRWIAIPGAVAAVGGIGVAVLVSYRNQQAQQQTNQAAQQAAEAESA